jgi:hypothetical protein
MGSKISEERQFGALAVKVLVFAFVGHIESWHRVTLYSVNLVNECLNSTGGVLCRFNSLLHIFSLAATSFSLANHLAVSLSRGFHRIAERLQNFSCTGPSYRFVTKWADEYTMSSSSCSLFGGKTRAHRPCVGVHTGCSSSQSGTKDLQSLRGRARARRAQSSTTAVEGGSEGGEGGESKEVERPETFRIDQKTIRASAKTERGFRPPA